MRYFLYVLLSHMQDASPGTGIWTNLQYKSFGAKFTVNYKVYNKINEVAENHACHTQKMFTCRFTKFYISTSHMQDGSWTCDPF